MKIVTGKSLCGLSRPNGSFFLWGTYFPKIISGRSQRSWRLTSSSLKPVPGRVEPQINRQTVFGGFESSFFPACLSFMAVLARLLKRAFAAPLSDKGHGVGASGRRLIRNEKKGCGVISWTRKPDEPDNFYHCAKALKKCVNEKWKPF